MNPNRSMAVGAERWKHNTIMCIVVRAGRVSLWFCGRVPALGVRARVQKRGGAIMQPCRTRVVRARRVSVCPCSQMGNIDGLRGRELWPQSVSSERLRDTEWHGTKAQKHGTRSWGCPVPPHLLAQQGSIVAGLRPPSPHLQNLGLSPHIKTIHGSVYGAVHGPSRGPCHDSSSTQNQFAFSIETMKTVSQQSMAQCVARSAPLCSC